MTERLTPTQIDAMKELERSITGKLVFGSGFGKYRVALRPLTKRQLINYNVLPNGAEEFSMSSKGLQALIEATS